MFELNGRFENASILLKAVVYPLVLSRSSSVTIFTCPFVSFAVNGIHYDFGGIFIYLVMRTRCGAFSSYDGITFCTLSLLPLCTLVRSLKTCIGISLNRYGTILRSGVKITLTNLSMSEVTSFTGAANLRTTPKTTVTLESHFPTRNHNVPTTLLFWFTEFLGATQLFASIAFSHSASMKSSRMKCGPSPVPKILSIVASC